jgi:hypothetical protein
MESYFGVRLSLNLLVLERRHPRLRSWGMSYPLSIQEVINKFGGPHIKVIPCLLKCCLSLMNFQSGVSSAIRG